MKKLIVIFAIYMMFFSISCISKSKNIQSSQNNDIIKTSIEGVDYVILSKDDVWVKKWFENYFEAELTFDDIENINNILYDAVENYNKTMKQDFEKDIVLSNYKRQYIAVINKNGEKEVYVNCFNNKRIEDNGYWKTEYVLVLDGGNNYFQVMINLSKKIYYNFFANGYA
jgi:hypothetical protein